MDRATVEQCILHTSRLRRALVAVRDAGPPAAWVAAGAVRDVVWDVLLGASAGAPDADIDVIHFDPHPGPDADILHCARLSRCLTGYGWEVTNQAVVHRWHSARLGREIAPYPSVEAAMAGWPETATAVGARLDAGDRVHLLAPLGLDDLVNGVVRPNPRCPDPGAYRARLKDKRWSERWPKLTVIAP